MPHPFPLDPQAFLLDVLWGKGTILIPCDAISLQDFCSPQCTFSALANQRRQEHNH